MHFPNDFKVQSHLHIEKLHNFQSYNEHEKLTKKNEHELKIMPSFCQMSRLQGITVTQKCAKDTV